jgi:hypothetical protein
MGRKKNLHYGTRDGKGGVVRMSVSDRTSKSARPWNDPDVVTAAQTYGVKLNSHLDVASHEDKLEMQGSLETNERMTCIQCSKFNKNCGCTEEWS